MRLFAAFVGLLLLVTLTACGSSQEEAAAVWFPDLGTHHRDVRTSVPEAQEWVDQAFTLYFGFNHEEAILSFQRAIELDPDCVMAHWGVAYCAGPNINNPVMDEAMSKLAYDTAQHALTLDASGVERELVEALAKRYAWPAPEDRTELDQAYADAMRAVWEAHPKDADVGALYAESLMDLRPWDLWTPEGEPQPGTREIMTILETVMALSPEHPGANHFYIHTVEASPHPELAADAADRLRDRVPGSGHLVHMPGHIDIRLGRYDLAIEANQKGIAADLAYVEATGRGGFYTMYRAHNYHFLAYAAMFDGQKAVAVTAARDMIDQVPLDLVRAFPDFLDAFMGVPIHVLVRFGLWDDLLAEPSPPSDLYAAVATWHYGRTMAFSSQGRVKEAAKEFAALRVAVENVPETRNLGNNPMSDVFAIGLLLAQGELEYRRGHHDKAFQLLRDAVVLDDQLRYDEPWGWMQPVRHALGALLTEQKRYDEAAEVFRKDLEIHPNNGWALLGLETCLRELGKEGEANRVRQQFTEAWSRSDIVIRASCFCANATS